MKTNRKALLLVLCAVTLVAGSVFGTFAYLTDTEAVTNTFTVGSVYIELDESDVDDSTPGKDRDYANKYHLIPGHTYIKDPTIYVDADSEDCYLFVKVVNEISAIETTEKAKKIAGQMENLNWVAVPGETNVYVLAKGEGDAKFKYTVSKGATVEVFKEFTIDGSVTNDRLAPYKGKSVVVTAYAVQADGFDTSLAAWEAAFKK